MKYEITEEQIKELAKGNAKVKKMFPEVFETKLEVGKWYWYAGCLLVWNNGETTYGFNHNCFDENYYFSVADARPATDSEVLEALTNEAKKRGFKEGVYINDIYNGSDSEIITSSKYDYEEVPHGEYKGKMALRDPSGNILFIDGIWAEIIKTYTKEEAEKLLNAKII